MLRTPCGAAKQIGCENIVFQIEKIFFTKNQGQRFRDQMSWNSWAEKACAFMVLCCPLLGTCVHWLSTVCCDRRNQAKQDSQH